MAWARHVCTWIVHEDIARLGVQSRPRPAATPQAQRCFADRQLWQHLYRAEGRDNDERR